MSVFLAPFSSAAQLIPSTSILSPSLLMFEFFGFVIFGASALYQSATGTVTPPPPPSHPYSPVITTSPSFAIAASNALLRAWFNAFSTFLAFLPDSGAAGPAVGWRTLLVAVPRVFFVIFPAFRFCTLLRLALRFSLLGTLGLPREGIVGWARYKKFTGRGKFRSGEQRWIFIFMHVSDGALFSRLRLEIAQPQPQLPAFVIYNAAAEHVAFPPRLFSCLRLHDLGLGTRKDLCTHIFAFIEPPKCRGQVSF
jgi:hypothetical protein